MDTIDKFSIKDDNKTYYIPLASIDIENLKSRHKSRSKLDSLDSNTYYYFEVYKKHDEIEDIPENNSIYTCDLCAMAVPSMFRARHESSAMHRACASIARTALDRMARLSDVNRPNDTSRDSVFESNTVSYCSACARAVPCAVRPQHEQTTAHRAAAVRLTHLRDLRRVYTGSDSSRSSSDTDSDTAETKKSVSDEKVQQAYPRSDCEYKSGVSKSNSIEMREKALCDDDLPSSEITKKQAKPVKNEKYCDICNVAIENKKIHHKSWEHRRKNYLEKSKIRHHHMGKADDSLLLKCRICVTLLPNDNEEVAKHVESYDHEQKYQSMLSLNKIQKLDNETSSCQICYCKVLEMEELFHIKGAKHIKNLEKRLALETKTSEDDYDNKACYNRYDGKGDCVDEHSVVDENNVKIDNIFNNRESNSTYEVEPLLHCYICNVYVNNLINHRLETFHMKNIADRHAVTRPYYYMKNTQGDIFRCVACDVVCLNLLCRDSHINGKKHKKTHSSVLLEQLIEGLYCEYCDSILNYYTSHKHNCNPDHKPRRNRIKNANLKVNNSCYCEICDVDMSNHPPNIKQHNSGMNHKNKTNKLLLRNSIKLQKNNSYFCFKCNVYLSKNSAFKHLESEKHNKEEFQLENNNSYS